MEKELNHHSSSLANVTKIRFIAWVEMTYSIGKITRIIHK
jgi:hypothetical protein